MNHRRMYLIPVFRVLLTLSVLTPPILTALDRGPADVENVSQTGKIWDFTW